MSAAASSAPGRSSTRNKAAVLGHPIEHSLSPVLHRAAYDALGLNWTYEAVDTDAPELSGFLDACDESWAGVSLTMPLKTIAMALVDTVDASARVVDAVNTIVWNNGHRTGYNTDVYGMCRAIEEVRGDARISSVAVVGAGATARSSLASIANLLESGQIQETDQLLAVDVFARRRESAEQLQQFVSHSTLANRVHVIVHPWANRGHAFVRDLVVSTLPGSAVADVVEPGIDFPSDVTPGILMDVSYSPWPTPLAHLWRERGGVAATGDQMLLWQAAEQVRLMTGCEPPVDAMRTALVDSLRERAQHG